MSGMTLDYVINLMEGTFGKNIKKAQQQTSQMDGMVKKLGATLAGVFAVQKLGGLIEEAVQVEAKFGALEQRIKTVSATQEEANKNIAFAKNLAMGLKLPLEETFDSWSRVAAATRNTALEGAGARKAFEGISIGARALKVEGEQLHSTFDAFDKMLNTNKVTMQDVLRVASNMPGGEAIMADAMGMNTAKFTEQVSKGLIDAQELFLRFGDKMKQNFEAKIPEAVNTLQAKIVDLENQTTLSMREIGSSTSEAYLTWLQIKLQVLDVIKGAATFYQEHQGLIHGIAGAVLGLVSILGTYALVMKIGAGVTKAMTIAQAAYKAMTILSTISTIGFKGAWIALNAAFAVSPIGAIITLVAGLVAVVVLAYQKSETFRAVLAGLGETGVAVLKNLYYHFKLLMAPIRIAVGFLQDGPKGAKAAMDAIKQDAIDLANNTKDIYTGKTFMDGYNKSLEKSAADKAKKEKEKENALAGVGDDTDMQTILQNIEKQKHGGKGGGSESVSSGRTVRNVSVKIDRQIFDLKVYTSTAKESMGDIKRLMQDAINRAVLDLEGAL